MSTFRVCFCFWRRFKIKEPEPPSDIKSLFEQYSENGIMGIDHFHRFLMEFQRERNVTKEDAEAIFHNIQHLSIFRKGGLHLHAFFRYLRDDHNLPIPPCSEVFLIMPHYLSFCCHFDLIIPKLSSHSAPFYQLCSNMSSFRSLF